MKTIQLKIKQNRSRNEWKIEKKNQIETRYNSSPNSYYSDQGIAASDATTIKML